MHVKTGPLLLISLSLGLQLASTPAMSAAESAAEGLLIEQPKARSGTGVTSVPAGPTGR